MEKTLQLIMILLASVGVYFSVIGGDTEALPKPPIASISPIAVINEGMIDNFRYKIIIPTSEKNLSDTFLTQFPKANIHAFINKESINKLDIYGYYAWYDNSVILHTVVKKDSKVIIISMPVLQTVTPQTLSIQETNLLSLINQIENKHNGNVK